MKEKKRERKERGRFSGFANREKYPRYAIAKKIYVLLTKSFSPWTHCMEAFRHPDPHAPSNLKYALQPLKYAKMR